MTDPLRGRHEPIRPVDPDPVLARRLRARIERALAQIVDPFGHRWGLHSPLR